MFTKQDFINSIYRETGSISNIDLKRWVMFCVKIGFVSKENIDWNSFKQS